MAEIAYKSGSGGALWKSGLLPVYLFWGEEDRLKEEAVAALIKKVVVADFADFDLEIVDGGRAGADAILAAAGQVPFGSERRLVVARGMEQWRDRNRQAEVERLADGLAKLGDTACIALVVAAEEDEDRRKTAIGVKLDNAVKKIGATVLCAGLRGENLVGWVTERVRSEGKKLSGDAAQALIEAVGTDMRPLEQEIVKLVCYVGEREAITLRDIGTVVASSPEDVMFATVDAVTKRQTDRALSLLAELHRFEPKPQAVAGKLLSLLARQYRMLWQAKYLVEKRVQPRDVRNLPPEIAAELPGESNIASMPFKAAEWFTQAKGYSWAELTRAMERLLLCDLANKGGATDETGTFGGDVTANLQLLFLELTGATKTGERRTAQTR